MTLASSEVLEGERFGSVIGCKTADAQRRPPVGPPGKDGPLLV